MSTSRKKMGITLFLFMCMTLFLTSTFSQAQENTSSEQRSTDSSNPRENVALLEKEIETFKLRVLPMLGDRSVAEATEVFFEQVEALYDTVGQPFKWPWANFYDLYIFATDHNVQWGPEYCIRGIPSSGEISEYEAIAIAKKTVLSLTDTSSDTLEMYWVSTSYYKTHPDREYSWHIDFVVETPKDDSPYYVKFFLEIDCKTGYIYDFFDTRGSRF